MKGRETMKKKRLNIEDRLLIEELLKLNYKLKDLAKVIEVESSTISREIKNRRKPDKSNDVCLKTNKYPFICYNWLSEKKLRFLRSTELLNILQSRLSSTYFLNL